MTQYQDLIERVKAVTGPDRELDADVYCAAIGVQRFGWARDGLAENVPVNCRVYGKDQDHVNAGFGMSVGEFRAARSFLANLKGAE